MISIDTIRLRIRRPVINPNAGLTITPLAQRHGNDSYSRVFVFVDAAGGETQLVREVDMHQDYIHIMSKAGYLMIGFHMPQVAAQDVAAYRPPTKEEVQAVLELVQDWCRTNAGVSFVYRDLELSRLDIFANAESRFSFVEYAPLFKLLRFDRKHVARYPNSFYGYNACQGTCIYDRGNRTMNINHEAHPITGNLIRWELRLKQAKSIHRALGMRTVGDLLDNWQSLRVLYASQVRTALRIGEELVQDAPVSDIKSEIRRFQQEPDDTRALLRWVEAHGARRVHERWPEIPDLKVVLYELGYAPYQVNRFLWRYRNALTERLAGDTVSINDLRNELFTKLLA